MSNKISYFCFVFLLIKLNSCCISSFHNNSIEFMLDQIESYENLEYTSHLVKNEFIFMYKNYHFKSERYKIIREFLNRNDLKNFNIIQKNEYVDHLKSDFDVVQAEFDLKQLSNNLNKNDFIKSITQQRKVTRTLKGTNKKARNHELLKYSKLTNEIESEENDENDLELTNHESGFQYKKRKLFRAIPRQIIDQLNVRYFWNKGITGKDIRIAIFDTGLEDKHPHFKNIIERTDWTDEKNPDDKIGHGTFVCGVISSYKDCLGIVPDADIYVFKVFTDNQVSYTSWFLDAFNYAISKKIDILNLSIGGPDFMDIPFTKKVNEVTSKNIIMVSGIGNDGPLYGTLNNPADQSDVIGVGGINSDDQIAKFSSRGMTTWELPNGYGRVKPDILTYSTHVRASKKKYGCKTLSGTSVASPIIAGCTALLKSSAKFTNLDKNIINPGSMKQIIMAGAERVANVNIFEQGFGKMNLIESYKVLLNYKPQASIVPSYIDFTECPYFWPYCSQPLYYSAQPIILNLTIINGMNVNGKIVNRPKWCPSELNNGHYLKLSFSYSENLWPWSGYLGVEITVSEEAKYYEGLAEGIIKIKIESPSDDINSKIPILSEIKFYLKAKIITTPLRQQRILWDQFHNLRYPSGYFPRDDLKQKTNPLDWNADHIHTNFKDLYQYLRNAGFFIEVLGHNYNCYDASNYGTLLIVDPEEEFHPDEIDKLYDDITKNGLSLIVFAEWYNKSVIKAAKFFDENTRKWWSPITGGANLPALNTLLKKFDILFGDKIYEGEFKIGDHVTLFSSGTSIIKFPKTDKSYLLKRELKDQGEEFLADAANRTSETKLENIPIIGLTQTKNNGDESNSGRIVVYGDSNCIDSTHMKKDCFWLLSAFIEYTSYNLLYSGFKEPNDLNFDKIYLNSHLPKRLAKTNIQNYSKIVKEIRNENDIKYFDLECKKINYEPNYPIENIPIKYLPKKENYYNFLNLNKIFELKDESVFLNSKKFNNYKNIEDGENDVNKNKIKIENGINLVDSINVYIFETSFPLLTTISILIVLIFFACQIKRLRKRLKLKKLRKNLLFNREKFTSKD